MNQLILSFLVLLLFGSALVSTALGIFIFTRRNGRAAVDLGVLAFLIAEWTVAYGLELASPDMPAKIFWAQFAYIGIAFVPLVWLYFAISYAGLETAGRLKFLGMLAIFPLITIIVAFTNHWHGLFWSDAFLEPVGEINFLVTRRGIWFWVHFAVSYLFLLAGTIIILRGLRRMQGLYRAQIWALFFAVSLPWASNVIYFVTPIAIDLTPFAFTFTIMLLVWAIFGYRLTDITPVARDLVVDSMREGLIVLDMNGKVVDINPAAARMIGLPAREVLGQPIAETLSPWPDLIERFRGVTEGDADFSIGQGELLRHYQVRFTLLHDRRGNLIGRLIHLHELDAPAQAARVAERELFTQPLQDVAQTDAPDFVAAQHAPAPNPVLGWMRDFFMPAVLDESFMPGNMNKTWEQTIERAVTVVARFIMVFGSLFGYATLSDLNFQDRPEYVVTILSFLAGTYFLGLVRTAPVKFRVWLFVMLIYGMALFELLKHGFSASVFIYFMALVVLAHMLLNLRGAMIILALAASTMILFAWSVLLGAFVPLEVENTIGVVLPADLASATTNIIGYLFSALTMMTVVNMFIVNLNQAWKRESQALSLVQQERDLLEQRVRERTSELREARDLALQSRDELRAYYQAIEQSGNSIVITNLQGALEYANPYFEKATGYSIGEVIGQNMRILNSGAQSPEFYRHLWKTITAGEIWQGEFLNRRKDGSLYWEFSTIAPVKDEQGKVTRYVAIKEDITAQKELRETLARQNEYLAALQNITLELLNRRDRQELLDNILQRARGMLDAPLGAVLLFENEQLIFRAITEHRRELLGQSASMETFPLAWEALKKRRPVAVANYQEKYGLYRVAEEQILYAAADFPIISAGQVLGVIALGRTEPEKPFTASQIEFGQSLAQIAALVLDNANLYDSALHELEERKRIQASLEVSEQEQRALAATLQIGMSEEPLEAILFSALDHLLSINWLGIEAKGGIFLKDQQSDSLLLTVQRNLHPEICSLCQRVEFGKCLCGRAALTRQLQFSDHLDDLHEITYEGILDHGHYNVPILSGEQVLGVIVLYLPAGYTYDERDVRFLQSFASTLSNIIRRKRTEDLLRESETRFRQIVENASDVIYRMDTQGQMTYINPVGLQLMGYASEQELLSKSFIEFVAPAWRNRVQAFYKRQAIKGEQNTYYEFQVLTKGGRLVWFGQNVQLIHQPDGGVGFQAVARDITELKETQRALEEARDQALEASRFKSQLVSRISHELRTPLGGVLGYAELLSQGAFGELSEAQLDAASNIVSSANYLSLMINELLDQAQIEARAVKIHLAAFEPAILLRSVQANLTILALNKGLQFIPKLDPALPGSLVGDERRLQQVLINLAGNAIKFTQQGQVQVSLLRLSDSEWAMRVADTGIGIPSEAQEYIFDPFRQVDNTITRDNRGTGLGLSITKQLVELMGGRIELESEIGRGSTFTVILPLQVP
jgi:PAS domain S-box-containing protein